MSACCNDCCALDASRERQARTLRAVLAINAIMFVVIVAGAVYARSAALLSDSLDNLGDAVTYALSLYAVALGAKQKARVAVFKGILILVAAFVVAGQIGYRLIYPTVPVFEAMGAFSILGLVANGICLALLWRHRNEDINMSSVWECSKNDIASNVAVFVTAVAVWVTGSGWPDVLVACGLVLLFLQSAFKVLTGARAELRLAKTP
jgi:Co/Zn/Cd efflux system component